MEDYLDYLLRHRRLIAYIFSDLATSRTPRSPAGALSGARA